MLCLIDPTAQRLFEGTEFETLTVNQFATIFAHLGKGYTKKLALGNLAKLVFWSISSFKNWSYVKLPSFFVCLFLWWEERACQLISCVSSDFSNQRYAFYEHLYNYCLLWKLFIFKKWTAFITNRNYISVHRKRTSGLKSQRKRTRYPDKFFTSYISIFIY